MSEISKLKQNIIIKKIDSETVNLSIMNNEMLMAIVGQFDQNLNIPIQTFILGVTLSPVKETKKI